MRDAERPAELLAGPFTVRQARAAGLTPRQLDSGAWRRIVHGVYVARDAEDSPLLRARAVALVLPRGAVVAHRTAAWLHGVDLLPLGDDRVDVVAVRGDQIRVKGVRATSAQLRPTDVTSVSGVPVTTPTRTAADLARLSNLIEGVVALDAFLANGTVSREEVGVTLQACRGWRGVARARHALGLAETGVQSVMESRQRMALVVAGLPRPQVQIPLSDGGPPFAVLDNGYEQWRVGVDYDGACHANRWRQDVERQERIRAQGWWHRRYTAVDAAAGWRLMVVDVGRALYRAGWRPA